MRLSAVPLLLALTVLTGCAASATPAADPTAATADTRAPREVAEPPHHLTTIDPGGRVHHLDLADGGRDVIAEIKPVERLVSDGRYLFGIREGSVTVIDSGVWTRSHGDHFHYHVGPVRVLGEVEGDGVPTVVPGVTGTGVMFRGEAVLLAADALADGRIAETFRIRVAAHDGLTVPLTEGALVTEPDAAGAPARLRVVTADGSERSRIPCVGAAGTIATAVGVVVGCADGAVLAPGGDAARAERIPYPAGAAPADVASAAGVFAARESRPRVAALAGERGVWILDTRARSWALQDVGEPIVRATAIDDEQQRVAVLGADGSVLVLSQGRVAARTAPLVAESLRDPDAAATIELVVDQDHVYLNGPSERMLWEIDPADDARVTRTFATDTPPVHLAETGR